MPKPKLSNAGWRPHAVYELIDINRQTLFYWRDNVYPKANQKIFSTYEILLFNIIKIYNRNYGLQTTRLRKVDWPSILDQLEKISFSGFQDKILNIDLRDHSFKILTGSKEIDPTDGHNSVVKIDSISKNLINKILNFGTESIIEHTMFVNA